MKLDNIKTASKLSNVYTSLFENSINELYVFDQKTLRFTAVNRSARENIGYSEEELRFMSPLDIKPEFDKEYLLKKINDLVKDESERIRYNTIHLRKNGSTYPVESSIQLIDMGEEKHFLITAIDITERVAIKAKFKQKESVLEAVLESVRDAIVMLDDKGNVALWNDAAELLFGYTRDEVIGKDLHKFFDTGKYNHTSYQTAFSHFSDAGTINKIHKTIEVKAVHKNGSKLDLDVSISPIHIAGHLYGLSIIQDVSGRKQALAKLEESNKHYFELAENSPVGILRCDLGGNIIYANQNAADSLGSPSIDETKKVNLLTFPLLIQYGFSQKLEMCLKSNQSEVFEIDYESKWGKRLWLRIHMKSWVESGVITGAQVILDDIAEKKLMEEELRRLSVTDDLTKVYNRRFFIQKLNLEIERAVRYKSEFSIIMLDVDHFKNVNDSFGHHMGDIVLKNIAETVRNRIRRIDLLARWGGEEFVLLIPGTPAFQSKFLAEDLRMRLSQMSVAGAGKITASFGVTDFQAGDTEDTLIQRADDLMYKAKAAGRNRVMI